MWTELGASLERVIDAVVEASSPEITIVEAELELPLEVAVTNRGGRAVFWGSAPHTRWVSGFLPEVHKVDLRVQVMDEGT